MFRFNILTIDGGGLRGIYPAFILQEIENHLQIQVRSHFNLICGTSTGSIIAGSLAIGLNPSKIVELYQQHALEIFTTKGLTIDGMYKSKYLNTTLRSVLESYFGTITLGEIQSPLMIPATDLSNGNIFVFRSGFFKNSLRDRQTLLIDAITASCSAPTFFDPYQVQNFLMADGGLWANNPSTIAISEAMNYFGKHRRNIKLLSIGTGYSELNYSIKNGKKQNWGLMTGWDGAKFIATLLGLQSKSSDYFAQNLLPPDNYLRINFTRSSTPLDEPVILPDMLAKAAEDYHLFHDNLEKFLK